jgi:hypothetical protein
LPADELGDQFGAPPDIIIVTSPDRLDGRRGACLCWSEEGNVRELLASPGDVQDDDDAGTLVY